MLWKNNLSHFQGLNVFWDFKCSSVILPLWPPATESFSHHLMVVLLQRKHSLTPKVPFRKQQSTATQKPLTNWITTSQRRYFNGRGRMFLCKAGEPVTSFLCFFFLLKHSFSEKRSASQWTSNIECVFEFLPTLVNTWERSCCIHTTSHLNPFCWIRCSGAKSAAKTCCIEPLRTSSPNQSFSKWGHQGALWGILKVERKKQKNIYTVYIIWL